VVIQNFYGHDPQQPLPSSPPISFPRSYPYPTAVPHQFPLERLERISEQARQKSSTYKTLSILSWIAVFFFVYAGSNHYASYSSIADPLMILFILALVFGIAASVKRNSFIKSETYKKFKSYDELNLEIRKRKGYPIRKRRYVLPGGEIGEIEY